MTNTTTTNVIHYQSELLYTLSECFLTSFLCIHGVWPPVQLMGCSPTHKKSKAGSPLASRISTLLSSLENKNYAASNSSGGTYQHPTHLTYIPRLLLETFFLYAVWKTSGYSKRCVPILGKYWMGWWTQMCWVPMKLLRDLFSYFLLVVGQYKFK